MAASIERVLVNAVKDKLDRGETVASMTVRLVPSNEIVTIARTAGFDTIYVDMEHCPFSIETTCQIAQMGIASGVPVFVRVPANTPEYISRVLDGGAMGIIAPDVQSAEEARSVVAAAKYAPVGNRGASGILPQLAYRSYPAAEMYEAVNAATMVTIQFESAAALEKAEEIIAVDGVDMVLIGTNDLIADLGIPGQYDHPKVREAYERTIAACKKHGKHAAIGGLSSRPDLVAEFVKMGARYVSTGTDIAFLLGAATAKAKQVREIAG